MLNRMMIPCLLMAMSVFASSTSYAEASGKGMVFSGVVLEQGNNQLVSRFTAWLAYKANYPLAARFTGSYQELTEYLREHPDSLAWTCGVPFVEDHARDGQQLVAVPLFHGEPGYSSLVVARAGRSEKSLSDFKRQVFAYSDPRSNSGYIAPAYFLKKQGINIKTHFRYLMHTGLHEHSIEAVLAGLADVANIDEYVVVEYFKAHPEAKEKLVVLERFGPFPFTPIVAAREVPEDVVLRLQDALTNMGSEPEGTLLLKQLGLDGFVTRPDSFYQPIADMLNALKE